MHHLEGKRFGMLTVLQNAGSNRFKLRVWLCKCDCGATHLVDSAALISGRTKSCGCYRRSGKAQTTHGRKRDRVYWTWSNMKRRCNSPDPEISRYWGGRGITYDPRWESFEVFLADMGEPGDGMSLDRIDNNGNYCKQNCRWADKRTQRLNNRQIRMIMWNGKQQCVTDWEREYGLKKGTLLMRLRSGMPLERAMTAEKLHRLN